ncbi:hypothetical protein GYMLUDRAFT_977696 [Collybiopsis luxurians FD-317 M1]|nr:hypothetical protein GYMLUDRAFT_977696 [Collybiopsis luxurians FD-317 M1]
MVGFHYADFGGKTILEIGSRLFTLRKEAPNMPWADIDEEMDSNGFINNVKNSRVPFVYGDKNVVNYGEELTADDGVKSTAKTSAAKLHAGDIVDVAFSIIGIEGNSTGKGGQALLLLQSVMLLDTSCTSEWLKKKAMPKKNAPAKAGLQLKKQGAFDDKDPGEARKQFQSMTIDS